MTTPAYALAYLREVRFGTGIIEYLQKIDATLAPYGGRFLVHGGHLTPLEGQWTGDVVIVEFPSRAHAEQWYASPGYQEILTLRTDNSNGMTAILDGVEPGYQATDGLAKFIAAADAKAAGNSNAAAPA